MTDSLAAAILDAPDFVPVPTSARHDGWTADRQGRFIAALSVLGSVAAACRAVGLTPASAYRLRARVGAAGFAEAWETALAMGRDRVWAQAMDRALHGHTRPVMRNGRVVGHRRVFNDRLAYAIAYAMKPVA